MVPIQAETLLQYKYICDRSSAANAGQTEMAPSAFVALIKLL
jgi:hypothetical protein